MSIYEKDFLAWTEQQAVLLRRREAGHLVNDLDVDWANLAEEIESMGASQRSACRSRLAVLIQHLLKWRFQHERSLTSPSWRLTIVEQRQQLQDLFEDSPSLRRFAEQVLVSAFSNGRKLAEAETGLKFGITDVSPWSLDEILAEDFYPDPEPEPPKPQIIVDD